jgi:hypothetical protein
LKSLKKFGQVIKYETFIIKSFDQLKKTQFRSTDFRSNGPLSKIIIFDFKSQFKILNFWLLLFNLEHFLYLNFNTLQRKWQTFMSILFFATICTMTRKKVLFKFVLSLYTLPNLIFRLSVFSENFHLKYVWIV